MNIDSFLHTDDIPPCDSQLSVITECIISQLRRKEGFRSSPSGGSLDFWSDFCDQVQIGETWYFDSLIDEIVDITCTIVINLSHTDKSLLWLHTGKGWDWMMDRSETHHTDLLILGVVVPYIPDIAYMILDRIKAHASNERTELLEDLSAESSESDPFF